MGHNVRLRTSRAQQEAWGGSLYIKWFPACKGPVKETGVKPRPYLDLWIVVYPQAACDLTFLSVQGDGRDLSPPHQSCDQGVWQDRLVKGTLDL